jgi:Mycolic acid cyclopropane synthetase
MSLQSSLSSLSSLSLSSLSLPQKYDEIRPHHYIILYGTCFMIGNIISSSQMLSFLSKNGIWNGYKTKLYRFLSEFTERCIPLIYSGMIPDFIIRWGIRMKLRSHLHECYHQNVEEQLWMKQQIVSELHEMPIAIETIAANQQHYEVPTKFYDLCLGPCKKYSSGYWKQPPITTSFEQSEVDMLELYCIRANIQDGMKIVDLGCGWGSLTLYIIEKFPNCIITSISNSQSQREYIYKTAASRQLNIQNINVITVRI